MPKRSPFESYHKRQREINSKVYDIVLSANHTCLCGHVQGFHWNTDDGENLGKCVDADCPCEAFDEDVLYEARLRAELAGTSARREGPGDDDALTRAMRAEEQRDVSTDEAWDRAIHADRPRPNGSPRRSTKRDDAAMRKALRELGGEPI